jgi:hypothetical protein
VDSARSVLHRTDGAATDLRRSADQAGVALSELRQTVESLLVELVRSRDLLEKEQSARATIDLEMARLRHEADQAKATAAHERERLLEEQDQVIAALLEEQEEAGVVLAPDGAPEPASRPHADAISSDSEVTRLRQELRDAEQQIERLTTERERSREVLRRLQQQRDEAQQAVTRLTKEARSQGPGSIGHGGSVRPAPQPGAVPGPSRPPSALAAALAGTDPSKRRSEPRSGQDK